MEEGIWQLAVNFSITDEQLLLVISERDSEDIFDEQTNQRCPDDVPA